MSRFFRWMSKEVDMLSAHRGCTGILFGVRESSWRCCKGDEINSLRRRRVTKFGVTRKPPAYVPINTASLASLLDDPGPREASRSMLRPRASTYFTPFHISLTNLEFSAFEILQALPLFVDLNRFLKALLCVVTNWCTIARY